MIVTFTQVSVKFGQQGSNCGTATKGKFYGGAILTWEGDELASCKDSGYNLDIGEADVTIEHTPLTPSGADGSFCPRQLRVFLEHGGVYEADFNVYNVGGKTKKTLKAKKKSGPNQQLVDG